MHTSIARTGLALALLAPAMAGSAPLAAQSGAAQAASLSVTVTGMRAVRGRLVACLWRDGAGFPSCAKSRTARRIAVPVTATSMRIDFPGLAPGRYAVTVDHDENGDGKAGRNFIGMPTEGVGASNNPGGMPGFEKSLVDVAGQGAITVRMRYLFG